jgi:hypothetical protein
MRRTLILLALVLTGTALLACGKSNPVATQSSSAHVASSGSGAPPSVSTTAPKSPTTPTESGSSLAKQRALAFARAVNLTASDVPGFAPGARENKSSANEKRLEHQMMQCTGLSGNGSGKAVLEAGSPDFRLKHQIVDLSVNSEVSVQSSAAQAQQGLAAIRSPHTRGCFSRYLTQLFDGEQVKGAKAGPVTVQSGTPPAPGTSGGFGLRVTATFVVHRIKVPVYLDFLGFVDGASEVTLTSSGLLQPFPASIQQHLFALLLTRAKAHPL